MHCQNGDCLCIDIIGGNIALFAVKDEAIGTVPVLDDIQALKDFTPHFDVMQIATQKDGFDSPSEFGEGFVGGMMKVVAREALEDGFSLGCSKPKRGRIFDHLIILLANEFPIDNGLENRC